MIIIAMKISGWVRAANRSLLHKYMNMFFQVESITHNVTRNISAEYRDHVSLVHCNKVNPVVLHFDCASMKIEVTVYVLRFLVTDYNR